MKNLMKNEELRMKNYLAACLHSAAKFFILHSSFFIKFLIYIIIFFLIENFTIAIALIAASGTSIGSWCGL